MTYKEGSTITLRVSHTTVAHIIIWTIISVKNCTTNELCCSGNLPFNGTIATPRAIDNNNSHYANYDNVMVDIPICLLWHVLWTVLLFWIFWIDVTYVLFSLKNYISKLGIKYLAKREIVSTKFIKIFWSQFLGGSDWTQLDENKLKGPHQNQLSKLHYSCLTTYRATLSVTFAMSPAFCIECRAPWCCKFCLFFLNQSDYWHFIVFYRVCSEDAGWLRTCTCK